MVREAGATSSWLCFRGYISVAGASLVAFDLEVVGSEASMVLKEDCHTERPISFQGHRGCTRGTLVEHNRRCLAVGRYYNEAGK